jgi:hypothetical protein
VAWRCPFLESSVCTHVCVVVNNVWASALILPGAGMVAMAPLVRGGGGHGVCTSRKWWCCGLTWCGGEERMAVRAIRRSDEAVPCRENSSTDVVVRASLWAPVAPSRWSPPPPPLFSASSPFSQSRCETVATKVAARHGEGAMAVAPSFCSLAMGMACGGRWRGEGGYVEVIGALRLGLRSWRGLGLPWCLRFGVTTCSCFRTMVPRAVARA